MADPITTNVSAKPEAQAIIETMKDLGGATLMSVDNWGGTSLDVLILPNGKTVRSVKPFIDEYRLWPERRTGTATLTDIESFIDHANRFKDADSAIFARDDRKSPSLTAVLNYHRKGEADPRFGDHRAIYPFPLSDEWQAWTGAAGEKFGQGDFAAFLDDRILDIAPVPEWALPDTGVTPSTDSEIRLADAITRMGGTIATPQRVFELSRGLAVTESSAVENRVNLDTGEAVIAFKNEHTDGAGQKVKVPNLFMIVIPVFKGGPAYLMAVRLQYRIAGGKVVWLLAVSRMDEAFDHAFHEAADKARAATALPLFYGTPETVAAPRAAAGA
jgi:uncharacterized protein YfdQ (DUF2303 family)